MNKRAKLFLPSLVIFFIFILMLPLQLRADDDWSALEQALKQGGFISDPPAGTPPGGTVTPPPAQGPPPPGGTQGQGTGTGSGNAQTPTPPTGTTPTPSQGQGAAGAAGTQPPEGPVFPTGPNGKSLPLPSPSESSFPYNARNTDYGEYESEGGRLWREFRDGKLTSEQYQQKMNELRDRIREREERERREQEERERPEREARARAAREEGRARAREARERAEEHRRERKERERREREERQKSGNRVGMNQTGEGMFQAADAFHAGLPQTGAPSARDMEPIGPEVARADDQSHESYHHNE